MWRRDKNQILPQSLQKEPYNSVVKVDGNLETSVPNMYALGDGSGVTHSLSQASASGVHVARILAEKY